MLRAAFSSFIQTIYQFNYCLLHVFDKKFQGEFWIVKKEVKIALYRYMQLVDH